MEGKQRSYVVEERREDGGGEPWWEALKVLSLSRFKALLLPLPLKSWK
jgi:hypothetical protein